MSAEPRAGRIENRLRDKPLAHRWCVAHTAPIQTEKPWRDRQAQPGSQYGLADAADAEQRNKPAPFIDSPLAQQFQLVAAADESSCVRRITPILSALVGIYRSLHGAGRCGFRGLVRGEKTSELLAVERGEQACALAFDGSPQLACLRHFSTAGQPTCLELCSG
jgi:hypothetical protein